MEVIKNLNYTFKCVEDSITKVVEIPVIGRIAGLVRILVSVAQCIAAFSILIFEQLRTRFRIDPNTRFRCDLLYKRASLNKKLGLIEFSPFDSKNNRNLRKSYLKRLHSDFENDEYNWPTYKPVKMDANTREIPMWNNEQLPKEISKIIEVDIKNIKPRYFLPEEIKACSKQLVGVFFVNKHFNAIFAPKMNDLKKTLYLTEKYHFYSLKYRKNVKDRNAVENPQLYDALSAGYKYGWYSTFEEYTPQIEEDIKEIVKLMPQSLNCSSGKFRGLKNVTPLFMACVNRDVPLHIIKFLLKNGADSDAQINEGVYNWSILDFIMYYSYFYGQKRCIDVEKLFKKYGSAQKREIQSL